MKLLVFISPVISCFVMAILMYFNDLDKVYPKALKVIKGRKEMISN